MKNRILWRQRSTEPKAAMLSGVGTGNGSRQDSQESTISASSSIREFELFQQFCSNTPGPVDWETPAEVSETSCSWETGVTNTGRSSAADDLVDRRFPTASSSSLHPYVVAPTSCTVSRSISSPSPGTWRQAPIDYDKTRPSSSSSAACRRRRQLWSSKRRQLNHPQWSSCGTPDGHPPLTPPGHDDETSAQSRRRRQLVNQRSLPDTMMSPQCCHVGDSQSEVVPVVTQLPPSSETRALTLSRDVVPCVVRLLDGEEFRMEIPRKSLGHVIFDAVCSHLNLLEREYFALSYKDNDCTKMWLRTERKIAKQLGDNLTFVLVFEVKFYPPDISTLHEDITRYLLCLQIQQDISSGKILCSFLTYALLGSYLTQSLLGDNIAMTNGTGCNYLQSVAQFAPEDISDEELLRKISDLHRTHCGMNAADAELEYLINASRMAMYGVDLHLVQEFEGDSVSVGVCASGIMVYKDLLRMKRYAWVRIMKVTYKGCNFYVTLREAKVGASGDEFYIAKFKMATKQLAKKLWRSVVEHHTFFRMDSTPDEEEGLLSRLFRSQFRFSGRTQQQVRRDVAAINRRPVIVARQRRAPSNSRMLSESHAKIDNVTVGGQNVDSLDDLQPQQLLDDVTKTLTVSSYTPVEKAVESRQGDPINCDSRRNNSPVASSMSIGTTSLYERKTTPTPSHCSSDTSSATVRTQSRTVTVTTLGNSGRSAESRSTVTADDFGVLISAHSHTSRTHTVETTMYQTEKDGVIEMRVEKKLLVNPEGSDNVEKVLEEAIQSVAAMGSELCVEKLEIRTMTELVLE